MSLYFFRLYRYIAYRRYTRWLWHRLGKKTRKVIPSCVVSAIRTRFPSDEYTGFMYPRDYWERRIHRKRPRKKKCDMSQWIYFVLNKNWTIDYNMFVHKNLSISGHSKCLYASVGNLNMKNINLVVVIYM